VGTLERLKRDKSAAKLHFNNITGIRTDLNHIVFWFADPADDEDCVPGSAPGHFDGDGQSGIAAMSSKNFLPGAPLP
jgi:hypothetical protein